MDEKEHERVEGSPRAADAKKSAKPDSRAHYFIKMGLVTVVLFGLAYVVETKLVLTLLGAPTPWE